MESKLNLFVNKEFMPDFLNAFATSKNMAAAGIFLLRFSLYLYWKYTIVDVYYESFLKQ